MRTRHTRAVTALVPLALLATTLAACTSTANDTTTSTTGTTMPMTGDMENMAHEHDGGHDVTWSPPPSVAVTATQAGSDSFDLAITTENFQFIPEDAPADVTPGEGHAHVYLDGRVQAMIYGTTFHLEYVPPGTHEVRVELSAADHEPWLVDGEPVDATTTVTVEGDAEMPDATIEISVEGEAVVGGATRHSVALGDRVRITVTSDAADQVHLHGYDIAAEIDESGTAVIEFTADIPGIFEIEMEGIGLPLGELEVS